MDVREKLSSKKRLIDADALHRKVKTETNPYGKPTIDYDSGVKVLEWIDKAPTIDAVKVVRCRDCKHRYSDSWCEYVDDDDNFYCARGERKDGDAAGGLESVAETRFVYCPKCGARMDGGSYAKPEE